MGASCMHIVLVWPSIRGRQLKVFFSHDVMRAYQSRHSIVIYAATRGDGICRLCA